MNFMNNDGGEGVRETLYMQQHPNVGLLRNVSPGGGRLNRLDEQQLIMRRQEEDTRSCKDSGNGDSAKERNPTSSSDDEEEMDEMIELQEQRRGLNAVSIQRNRLNEYLGDDVLYVGGKNSNHQPQLPPMAGAEGRSMSGSTFKGSSGNILGGEGNRSSLSNMNNNNNSNSIVINQVA